MNIAGYIVIAVGLFGAAAFATPQPASMPAEAPFWQLHGVAPQAREGSLIESQRLDARQGEFKIANVAASD